MIRFSCFHCGLRFKVKDEYSGKSTRCPTCRQLLKVPESHVAQGVVPTGKIDGLPSCLQQAGLNIAVTLPPSPRPALQKEPNSPRQSPPSTSKQESVLELLAAHSGQTSRYVLEKELARGGMGAVLRGIDRDIRREVAIKFMLNDNDPKHQARFIEEAQITGQLEHPNIVPVHELGVDAQKRLFFTMKMVRGRSLAQVLEGLQSGSESEKEWTLSRLLNMLVNVCHALAYAHARHVIHRDLKPANIMVGDFGEVYVMDWGLAKVLGTGVSDSSQRGAETAGGKQGSTILHSPASKSSMSDSSLKEVMTNPRVDGDLTQEGTIMGTPLYMSPEQASGQVSALDQRSDIYSLGAILYAILTLQAPIGKGGDYLALLIRVCEGTIQRPEDRAPKRARQGLVPAELSAIAMKALAKEPADRYQTVEAFRHDIELFLEGRTVSAKEDTKWEMAKKFVKRNKGFSTATGTAVLVLVTVVSFFLRINYTARLHAEKQERLAVQAKLDFEKSQREKDQTVRDSLPAFVGAGRQLANEGKFSEAQKQAEVALVYDPQNSAAQLLKGQILIAQKDWIAARTELTQYLRHEPKDEAARTLLELSQKDNQDPAVLFAMTEVLGTQKLYGLAGALVKDIQDGVATRAPMLQLYQKQIEDAWPTLGNQLRLGANGQFSLNLVGKKQVASLQPLKNMRLHKLYVSDCANLNDLEPLRDMPLAVLDLINCVHIHDIRPLQKMPLTELYLQGTQVADLSPLQDKPLARLQMNSCRNVADLSPLQGLPLQYLELTACFQIADVRPLCGLTRLTDLNLNGCVKVSDLEPLRDLPLQRLCIGGVATHTLAPLKNMPLTTLEMESMPYVSDLSPLKGMSLKSLTIWRCLKIRDLTPLDGMKLQTITLMPQFIEEGMDVLRRMESLASIVADREALPPDVFWKRYDAGEFHKQQ